VIRAILDANVLISYLLANRSDSVFVALVSSAAAGRFQILVSPGLLVETIASATTKPKLESRVTRAQIGQLVQLLLESGEVIPELESAPAPIFRDPKDDYLLAHAILEGADYLVSGDRDLLALRDISPVKIVSPAEFMLVLSELPEEDD
jgi:putative PIN family toxin of toxin-antitoxin system